MLAPSNIYTATCLAVSHAGATLVLVESELATSNLDPILMKEALTPRTRVIIPQHLYGPPCRMPEPIATAEQYGLLL